MGKSTYLARKAMGKCVKCGQTAEPERLLCLVCRMDRRLKGDTHSEEAKIRHTVWLKRRRELLYAFGVCVVCGKRDAMKNSASCEWCNAKAKIRSEKKRRENNNITPKVLMDGISICARCGKAKTNNGHKVCDDCYSALREKMLYARSQKNGRNYFEKIMYSKC